MPVRYQCPGCSQWLSISRKKIGQAVPCPKCGAERVIPERDEAAQAGRGVMAPPVVEEFAEYVEPAVEPPSPDGVVPEAADGGEIEFASLDEPEPIRDAALQAEPRFGEWENEPARDQEVVVAPVRQVAPVAAEESRPHRESLAAHSGDRDEEDEEEGLMFRKRRDTFEDMDLTPMVDMMILLLIFFMVTTSKELQKALEMPAPGVDSGGAMQAQFNPEQLEDASIRVRIDDKNVVYIEDDPVGSMRQVLEKLKQQMRETQRYELIVSADPLAFHETVVTVVDAATAAGVQKIRMSGGGGE
jgi:biopolymer transport protein ExbD/DNA-directed RNA polymerase subunit RPC12/RpoP